MDIVNSKKSQAILDELALFLTQPVPRSIPKSLIRASRNRFARSVMLLLGFFLFIMFPVMLVTISIANGAIPINPGVYPAYLLMGLSACIFLWAFTLYRAAPIILANGRRYTGMIQNIRQLPLRMVSISYFLVTVTFTDESGQSRKVWDMVESTAVDEFYKALGNDEPVDIIAAPAIPRYGILVMKLPYQYIT